MIDDLRSWWMASLRIISRGRASFGQASLPQSDDPGREWANVQREFAGLVARYPPLEMQRILRALVERCDSEQFIVPGYAPALAARLRDLIIAGQPASLIRLGDGEGNVLGALSSSFPSLAADAMEGIMNIMFGRAPRHKAEVSALSNGIAEAVQNADIIGMPDLDRLKYIEHRIRVEGERGVYQDTRGISGSMNAVLYPAILLNAAPPMRSPTITSCYCHSDLLPFYDDLLKNVDNIGLISCYPSLPERLKSRWSLGHIDFFQIPDQASNSRAVGSSFENLTKAGHYPERFRELMKSLRVTRAGQIFLISAGILGKIYCNRLKQLGAIAIDIGSVADVWMGQPVRIYHDVDFLSRWRL